MELGEQFGYRNAQATVLAPTGTIGFMMDCDTTGVEPDIALVKYKKLVGGGLMKIVNTTVPMALTKLGYNDEQVAEIVAYIDEHETIEGAPYLKDEHLPVFDCAFKAAEGRALDPLHGPHQDDGRDAAVHLGRDQQDRQRAEGGHRRGDHAGLHRDAGSSGAKAISIYRDGSKRTQPLNTSKDKTRRRRGSGRSGRGGDDAADAPEAARRAPRRSRTSSTSPATRATSPSACSRTGSRARSSW